MEPIGHGAVRVRVVWVPAADDGRRGRVVVQRSGSMPDGPSAFWLSDPLPAGAVLGAGRAAAPAAWHDLLAGAPVGEVAGPVPLRPAERSALDALARELAGSDTAPGVQRPLLLATAELDDGVPVAARVVRFAGDVLSHAFDVVFEGAPPGLALARTTLGGSAAEDHETGTRLVVDAWIPVADVDAARPGSARGRVNLVVVSAAVPQADGVEIPDAAAVPLLADARVRRLATALAKDPVAAAARDALAAALAAGGRRVGAAATSVDVGGAGSEPVLDLLDGLVALAERAVDGDDAPIRVTLLAPTRAASALLAGDERLTAALVDYLLPPEDEAVTASLRRRRELRAALQAAAGGATGAGRTDP